MEGKIVTIHYSTLYIVVCEHYVKISSRVLSINAYNAKLVDEISISRWKLNLPPRQ